MRPKISKTSRTDSSKLRNASVNWALVEPMEDRCLFSTYVVTTTADSGTGSLRQAIKNANSHAGADVIDFNIGSGAKTITLATGLDYISDAVTIDGTTQPGYAGKPIIEISGPNGGYGLNIGAGNSTVKGLVLNKFSSGILLVKKGGDTIQNCYIGTDLTGTYAKPNLDKGIIVQTAGNTIGGTGLHQGNLISGNKTQGVQFYTYTAASNKILGNYIGTDATGMKAIPNGLSGVCINGAPNTVIGGTAAGSRNVISGNLQDGIVINTGGATGTLIEGNYVGVTADGKSKLGNQNYGVETSEGDTTIGGTTAAARNIISANYYTGVSLWMAGADGSVVEGNYIGTDVTGEKALGNYWRGVDITNGASDCLVGGTASGAANVISGNGINGITVYQGSSNDIINNVIGFAADRVTPLMNDANGIQLANAVSGLIQGNLIGNNGGTKGYGIFRTGGGSISVINNTIVKNPLFGITATTTSNPPPTPTPPTPTPPKPPTTPTTPPTPTPPSSTGTVTLSGYVINDLNANGAANSGEPVLANRTVYIDANNNGKLDAGEKTAVTTSGGKYTFSGLAAGTYTVREVIPSGWKQTGPSSGFYTVTLAAGATDSGLNFFTDA